MPLRLKIKNKLRGLTQRWGTSDMIRTLWDKEYASGKWDHCDSTPGDPVYGFVEKYCRNGSILDLGCGAGNTGNELAVNRYKEYTGVDLSEVAVRKAAQRSEREGRSKKNRYVQSDILSYVPKQKHDVILFRESLYQIRLDKINAVLDRYFPYLPEVGVFIAVISRNGTKRVREVVGLIGAKRRVIEKHSEASRESHIVVFR